MVFFFKQKTAYEIKECDWSSDVCSSDLVLLLYSASAAYAAAGANAAVLDEPCNTPLKLKIVGARRRLALCHSGRPVPILVFARSGSRPTTCRSVGVGSPLLAIND